MSCFPQCFMRGFSTVTEVVCCGRFMSKVDVHMYHTPGGTGHLCPASTRTQKHVIHWSMPPHLICLDRTQTHTTLCVSLTLTMIDGHVWLIKRQPPSFFCKSSMKIDGTTYLNPLSGAHTRRLLVMLSRPLQRICLQASAKVAWTFFNCLTEWMVVCF